MKRPFHILTSDILCIDTVTALEGNPGMQALAKEYGLQPGGKKTITLEDYDKFTWAAASHPRTDYPGGSSANLTVTLSRLMNPGDVKVDFICKVGSGGQSRMVAAAMEKAGINMIQPETPEGTEVKIAKHYALKYANGERTIVKYPGTAHKLLTPDLITDELVQKNDAILLQGSLWSKLDKSFSNKLYQLRSRHKKELWLALPTDAEFGSGHKAFFELLVPQANVVMSNMIELCRVTGEANAATKEEDLTPQQRDLALQHLQDAFISEAGQEAKRRIPGMERRVGFVTDGEHGGYVVTGDEIKKVEAVTVPKNEIVNTLGSGDTAFAGFMYGYLNGYNPTTSASIGMALASEKIKLESPRLEDPKATLQKTMAHLSQATGDSRAKPLSIIF